MKTVPPPPLVPFTPSSPESAERVLVPEMNTGQLAKLLRSEYLVNVVSHTKLEGKPLFAAELEHVMLELI